VPKLIWVLVFVLVKLTAKLPLYVAVELVPLANLISLLIVPELLIVTFPLKVTATLLPSAIRYDH